MQMRRRLYIPRRAWRSVGLKFRFVSMDRSAKLLLEQEFPGEFEFFSKDDYFDYIYSAEALRTLKGKKLHSKRNYINRFKELDTPLKGSRRTISRNAGK